MNIQLEKESFSSFGRKFIFNNILTQQTKKNARVHQALFRRVYR